MNVTANLVRVYRIDRQLDSLQSRLKSAEKFLEEQARQLKAAQARRASLETQLRQLKVAAAEHEGESARLEARITDLRARMNESRTNKEYQALLTEANTLKLDRDKADAAALELIGKLDEVAAQAAGIDAQINDRRALEAKAAADRDARFSEIKARVDELRTQRDTLAAAVSADVMRTYDDVRRRLGEAAMASIEEVDRKRHEFSCGACMMSIPIEAVSALLSHGALTICPACRCIMYLEDELIEKMQPATKR